MVGDLKKSQACTHVCVCVHTHGPRPCINYPIVCTSSSQKRVFSNPDPPQVDNVPLFAVAHTTPRPILAGREAKQRFLQQHPGLAVPAVPLRVGNAMI